MIPAPIIPGIQPVTPPGTETGEVIGPARELRFAPFPTTAARLQVRTSLTVEQEYTDNANQSKYDRKDEFRTVIAPGITANAAGARSALDFAYAPQLTIPEGCSGCSDTTALDHNLTLRGWYDLTPRLRISASDDFTRSSDFRQFGNLGAGTTAGKAVSNNAATGEAAYTFGPFRTGLSYSNLLVRSEASTSDNSTTHSGRGTFDYTNPRFGAGGSYALTRAVFDVASPYLDHTLEGHTYRVFTPTVRGTLSGTFTDHIVDDTNPAPGEDQNFVTTGGRLGAAVSVGPGGSLNAAAGADVFIPTGNAVRVFPAGSVTYNQRFASVAIALSYAEGISEQFQTVGVSGLTHTRSASLLFSSLLFRDLTGSLGIRFNWQKILQGTLQAQVPGEVDRTVDVESQVRYILLRPLVLTLSYVLTVRTSNVPTVEFVENRVRLSLSYLYNFL